MANFSALKTAIQNAIRQNGNEEITGDVLQQILLSVVNTMGDGAINTIEQNLSNETLARQNGDNTLQSNINAEALARGNADTQLQNAINAIKANIDNGYVYAGIATPSSTPVSGKVFYIATAAGTYTSFGSQVLTQGINILRFNGSAWSSQQLIGIDDVPTAGSNSLVKSGGVFPTINAVNKSLIPINGKVSIIGDSISTFAGTMPSGYTTYYPKPSLGVTSLYDMWWHLLLSMTHSALEINASWSGSRVTSINQNVPDFYDRTNILGSPDYIFVALGTNDSIGGVALGDYDYETEVLSESEFIPAYIKGIKALKTNYPNAKIVLFVFQMSDSYANAIKNIGKHYELDVIDVRSYYIDNVHPNKLQMCSVVQTASSFYIKGKCDDVPTAGSDNLVKSGGVFSDTINKAFKNLFDKFDFEVHTFHYEKQQIDKSPYNRIRMIYPVAPGMHIEAQCSEGRGMDITVQPLDLDTAIRAAISTRLQTITPYTLSKVHYKIKATGFLVISLCKSDESNFTESEKESYIAATTIALRKEVPSTEAANSYIAGFTSNPINIDNINRKIVWDKCYFRVNGEEVYVHEGEVSFDSYEGGNTALALILQIGARRGNYCEGSFLIAGNSFENTPNVHNNYVVAYFYRSGTTWQEGPVVSVYSNLPFSIDGKLFPIDANEIKQITKDSSCIAFYPEIQETGKCINDKGNIISSNGYKYSKPFNLEAGDVVIMNDNAGTYVAVLSKYDNGNYIPLCTGWQSSQVNDKYYFISDGGQYVLSCKGTLKCSIAKHIPLRLTYDTLFTKLRTTDNLVLSKEDFSQIHNFVTEANDYRLRLFCPIPKDSRVFAACSLGKGVAVSIYNNETQVCNASKDYLQTISYSYVSNVDAVANYDGYLVVSLCKNDNSEFTPQDIEDYLAATTITVTHQVHTCEGKVELFLGTLVQKALTANGLTDTNKENRVSTATCMVLPKESASLSFILPADYYVGIRSGDVSSNLLRNQFWYGNGDTFTFNVSDHYYRLCFAHIISKETYIPITVQEVGDLISSGFIHIYVNDWDYDIIGQNAEAEKYVKAVMRPLVSGGYNNPGLLKLPVFAHTSDVHGDANRFQAFADYCDFLHVDGALVSGDTVASNSIDSMQYINDIADSHNTKILICMGNHDARNLMTAEEQYNTILKHNIEKYSSVTNPDEEFPTYYYYDFTEKQIRLISINLYELNHSGDTANFTQEQCEWFISVLASTPQDYGVLVMFHSPEKMPVKDNNHGAFYQNIVNYTGLQAGITGNPFSQIIDAFIGRTAATISYTSNNDTSTTISVSADFTDVSSGVEFIAFVTGHLHVDRIGYSGTTYPQLNLNICCGVAIYGSTYPWLANNSDMPRGCDGATQNCFNIYVIDRVTKTVRVAKIGSNVSGELIERKCMIIPYA